MVVYKITRGLETQFAEDYPEAEKIYQRMSKRKYPCWEYTRLYCNLGDGHYDLMKVTGKRIRDALIPEHG